MQAAFFEIEPWEQEILTGKLPDLDLHFFEEKLDQRQLDLISQVEIISTFIYSLINRKVVGQLEHLKLVTTRSTGYDHIDIEACQEYGLTVSNVPVYGENTVAEHTFALILALSRRLEESFARTSQGNFSLEGLRGTELRGKTLGIVGLGNIGKNVARIANGFEMEILAYDLKRDKNLSQKLNLTYLKFEDLLKGSDIITLHVPYNPQTHHLINKANVKLFKPGSFLINTSRGGLIDNEALIWGLDNGILSGVGLDVLEEEALIKEEKQLLSKDLPKNQLRDLLTDHLLIRYPNVVITPHNAFNSREALQRILDTTVENIQAFLKGNPVNVVN